MKIEPNNLVKEKWLKTISMWLDSGEKVSGKIKIYVDNHLIMSWDFQNQY